MVETRISDHMGVGVGNFSEVQKDILPKFYAINILPKIICSCWYIIFSPTKLPETWKKFDTSNLVLNDPTEKNTLCKNIVTRQL